MFISNANGPTSGSFYSPNITNNKESPPHQCIYTFIANPHQRVKVVFEVFNLTGPSPECNHEYLDLYTELPTPESDLISTPFGGRYCGRLPPRPRISLYRTLVLGFYSDRQDIEGYFQGTYEFINASRYSVGSPLPNTTCNFVVSSNETLEGELVSFTYPGVYPKDLTCTYRFRGDVKGQRIRLEFMDFDLFFGGAHCPFDHVKFFDGPNTDAPLIGTYCGQRRNLVTYSSGEDLLVQFSTLKRTAEVTNRGFMATYEFSNRFVSLNFIRKNGGEHMRGSECDQKILSKKESSGIVFSPNYPFLYHQTTICRYYIYGLQDVQNLEHVRLEFEKFEIPSNDESCPDTYLKLYLRGQEDIPAFDKPDYTFCGRSLPPTIVSEGPRLVMVFSSGLSQGQGFKAKYTFETEYQIPGTQEPDRSCQFKYMSKSKSHGDFNTPRYPANYPSNITCTYVIVGERREQVRVFFEQFKVRASDTSMYGNDCQNDWVEIYNVYPDDSSQEIGRYCGNTAPGPIISDEGSNILKIVFKADKEDVATGFKVRYSFEPKTSIYGARGCPSAAVRVWKDLVSTPVELCGVSLDESHKQMISTGNVMRFMFITADKAVGAQGFEAIWTAISDDPGCDKFLCKVSNFCIPISMHCNGVQNCGYGDDSDEQNCIEITGVNVYLLVGVSVGLSAVILLVICMWCHRKHKRRRSESTGVLRTSDNRLAHTCEVSGARFSSMDSV
ncbi:CUB domain containing protein 2 [Chamberlinius hualienensis]